MRDYLEGSQIRTVVEGREKKCENGSNREVLPFGTIWANPENICEKAPGKKAGVERGIT